VSAAQRKAHPADSCKSWQRRSFLALATSACSRQQHVSASHQCSPLNNAQPCCQLPLRQHKMARPLASAAGAWQALRCYAADTACMVLWLCVFVHIWYDYVDLHNAFSSVTCLLQSKRSPAIFCSCRACSQAPSIVAQTDNSTARHVRAAAAAKKLVHRQRCRWRMLAGLFHLLLIVAVQQPCCCSWGMACR
jgi:hypothetical protein